MKINNGLSVLPWYDSLEKQNRKKWYAYGQSWPLLCPQGLLLPFQFISDTSISISSNIQAISVETGVTFNLDVKPTVTQVALTNTTYYIIKLNETTVPKLPVGKYTLRIDTSEGPLYSEELTVIDNAIDCIKVEYWNEDTLRFTSGEINFEDDFHFVLYINSTIGKPEYEFEEELTKRLGYKFIESQVSNKIYKFSFVAPEYICDAMRLIRMCDYIKVSTKYDSYNALSFAYEPKWQDQGDLAAVDVEFETDCIIQKLESFNRRLKDSFYNALLADESTPLLLDSETIAQYYTEYTAISSTNGKLIRQLESIGSSELENSLESLVLAIDNQSDETRKAKKIFLSDIYKYMSNVNSLFKGHYDENGNLKWIEALAHLGINGGISSYINNGTLNLPSLYAGLPIDNNTLYWEETTNEDGSVTKVLKAKGGGGSTEGGSVNWDDIKDEISKNYVSSNNGARMIWGQPLSGTSSITGELNLGTSGLLRKSSPYGTYDNIRIEMLKRTNNYPPRLSIQASDYNGRSPQGFISIGGIKDAMLQHFYILSDRTDVWGKLKLIADGEALGDTAKGIEMYVDSKKVLNINAVSGFNVSKFVYNGVDTLNLNAGVMRYNKDKGYWMFDGNLVITGGLTTFADSGAGNQWIMDAETLEEVTSKNEFKVYSAKVTSMIAASISGVTTNASDAINKLIAIKTAFNNLSSSSSASDIGGALKTLASNL